MYSRSDIAFRLCGTCSGAGSRSLLAYRLQKLVLKAKPTGSEWKCYSSAPSGSEKLVSRGEVDDDREAGHEAGDNGDSDRLIRLPPPKDVKIKTAKYVTSSVTLSQCPPPKLPEFAVIGRSNVGKSSLINMLTGSKSLALTSKQPGKTRTINHFLINDSWYLVDLPGYGYAKQAITRRIEWAKFTQEYFLKRPTLANVFLLVDASVPTQASDLESANWLVEAGVPMSIVFTKVDKRKKRVSGVDENVESFMQSLQEAWGSTPMAISTSAETGAGKAELLAYISQLRQVYKTERRSIVLPSSSRPPQ